jgi:hypothetical protein
MDKIYKKDFGRKGEVLKDELKFSFKLFKSKKEEPLPLYSFPTLRNSLPLPPSITLPSPPNSPKYKLPNSHVPSRPTFGDRTVSLGSQETANRFSNEFDAPLKMKVYYKEEIFVLPIQKGLKFLQVLEAIELKIKGSGLSLPTGRKIKLKYLDEDGDYISTTGDDDLEVAFSLAMKDTVMMFVE